MQSSYTNILYGAVLLVVIVLLSVQFVRARRASPYLFTARMLQLLLALGGGTFGLLYVILQELASFGVLDNNVAQSFKGVLAYALPILVIIGGVIRIYKIYLSDE